MSAHGYLKYLQNKIPVPKGMIKEFERVAEEFSSAGERAISLLKDNGLLSSDEIAFGLLPTFDRNAWALKSPTGGFVVCIDYLLPSALRMISRAIVESLASSGDPSRYGSSALEGSRGLWLAVKWFIERDPKYQTAWVGWQNSHNTLPHELEIMYNGLAGLQLDFVVMHELQHILCGHLEKNVTSSISRAAIDQAASAVKVLERTREQELEADTEVAKFFARYAGGVSVGAFSGCEIFFVFLNAIEQYLGINDAEASHPNAAIRLNAIRTAYDSCSGGMKGFGKKLRLIIDKYFELGFENSALWKEDDSILLDSGGLIKMQEDYIDSVTHGLELTHVTISGDCDASILKNISDFAKQMLQGMENVHLGAMVKEDTSKLYPDDYISRNVIISVATICAILTSVWVIKKDEFPDNAVSLDIFTKLIQEYSIAHGANSSIIFNIEDYPGDVPIAGDFCKIEIKDKEQQEGVVLEIAVMAATFSVMVNTSK